MRSVACSYGTDRVGSTRLADSPMTHLLPQSRCDHSEPLEGARESVAKPVCWRILSVCVALVIMSNWATSAQAGRVAILLSADVPEYQKAVEGFKKTTDDTVVGTYDMRGDFDRGKKLIEEIQSEVKPDLIYVVGIWALQAVEREKVTIPIVYSMVLNPPAVVDAKNVTGASMNPSVEETFKILKQLNPNLRKVGTLYNPKTTGFLIEQAKAAAKEMNVELVSIEVDSPRDAIGALGKLRRQSVDVVWVLPDRHVVAPTVLEQILLFSFRARVPVVGLSERHAEMGSLISVSFASSEDIGSQAGELAKQISAGRAVDQLAFTTARKLEVVVNLKSARKLGIEVPDELIKQASKVIR